MADEVPERGDRLDVVADVRRRLARRRVAVVHDREHRPVAGGRARRGRRVGRRGDPWPEPVPVHLGLRPTDPSLADVAVEDREHVAGQLLGPEAVDRAEDLEPAARAQLGRVLVDQAADLRERHLGRDREPGADVLAGGVRRPRATRQAAQVLPGQLGVAAPERGHAAGEVAERLGLGPPAERLRERLDGVVLLGGEQGTHLVDDGLLDAVPARERANERLAVRAGVDGLRRRGRGRRAVGVRLACGQHRTADDVRQIAADPAVAPGESAGSARHRGQGSRMTCSLLLCSSR